MKGHYQGLKFAGQQYRATFATDGTVEEGDAVAMTAAGTVGRGTAGDPVFAIAERVEADGHATVLMYGEVATVKRSGDITAVHPHLEVDGAGAVATMTDPEALGRPALVIGTQTENATDLATLVLL